MRPIRVPLALLACAFAASAAPAQDDADPAERPSRTTFELPAGPAATAWSAANGAQAPALIDARLAKLLDPGAWDGADNWAAWSAAVRRAPDGGARAELAAAALGQGRDEDAWDHFAALSASPATMLALLPAFAPGVHSGGAAAFDAQGFWCVPDGAHLTPRLPPLDRPASERLLGLGRLERRAITVRGVKIGGALVDMRVSVEHDGVQIDFDALEGTAARCTVSIPSPLDFELTTTYCDWERTADVRKPIAVRLEPGAPTLTLYGRCQPRDVRWPSARPAELEARTQLQGFALVCAPGDEACERVRGFAAALERLTGVPATAESLAAGAPTANPLATRIDLSRGPERDRKFRALVSTAETWALSRR